MTSIDVNLGNEFKISETLGRSFSIFGRNFFPFLVIVILFQVPAVVWSVSSGQYAVSFEDPNALSAINWSQTFGILFLSIILSFVASAAVIYGVFMDITGRKFTIGDCLSKSMSVLVPVIVMGIVVTLLFYIGLVFLIIPGVYVMVVTFVTFPVMIVEQPGFFSCLKRSGELTKGNRWGILGLSLILCVIIIGSVYLGQTIASLFMEMGFELIAVVVSTVVQAFFMIFWIVVEAVTYNKLRTIKEGISSEKIASVFG